MSMSMWPLPYSEAPPYWLDPMGTGPGRSLRPGLRVREREECLGLRERSLDRLLS